MSAFLDLCWQVIIEVSVLRNEMTWKHTGWPYLWHELNVSLDSLDKSNLNFLIFLVSFEGFAIYITF